MSGIAILVLVGVPVGAALIDAHRARVAEWTDRPEIVLEWGDEVTFPDAAHVRLTDGRTFRLANVVPPSATGPTLDPRTEQALSVASNGGGHNGFGLKQRGRSAEGEPLVEIWALRASLGGCGNATWSERRADRIRHWQPQTDALVRSGMYRLQPEVTDRDLRFWETYARQNGDGLWSEPTTIQSQFDRATLFDRVTRFVEGRQTVTLRERGEAAELLLRGWPESATSLVDFVCLDGPADARTRAVVAKALDAHGNVEGTRFLMSMLQRAGPNQKEEGRATLNAIAEEYGYLWNINPDAVLNHYLTTILPTRPTTRAATW